MSIKIIIAEDNHVSREEQKTMLNTYSDFDIIAETENGDALIKSFDTSVEALTEIWRTKHAKPRIKQLVKKGRNNNETLFYDDLTTLTWEEAKNKYLPAVGR